ncbi:hypothetical protein CDAR_85321 [Caerostris darwini]|uniref:Uncharacterized protein n=1 Tax=Caerostris darwini TaxID=1538125 RepID=A0AAV4T463_9ARAC|nr:hypothetical protein CDAR_85321 [Caerostris darwini]
MVQRPICNGVAFEVWLLPLKFEKSNFVFGTLKNQASPLLSGVNGAVGKYNRLVAVEITLYGFRDIFFDNLPEHLGPHGRRASVTGLRSVVCFWFLHMFGYLRGPPCAEESQRRLCRQQQCCTIGT